MKILPQKSKNSILAASFLLIAAQATAWALAVPLLSGPDEPSHIVTSVADIRGELVKRPIQGLAPAFQTTLVPKTFALTRNESLCLWNSYSQPGNCRLPTKTCQEYTNNVKAVCGLPLLGGSKDMSAITQSGRYPPLYSLITGIPTIFSTRPGSIYFMRLMGILISSIYVSLALYSVYRWSSNALMVAGISIALTPMAVYLMAVVNPSGFEISSALCLWVSGMVLVSEKFQKIPGELLAVVAASCFGLILSRPDSPIFAIFIIAILWYIAGQAIRKQISKEHYFYVYMCIAVAIWIIAMAWIVSQHASALVHGELYPQDSSIAYISRSVLGSLPQQLNQMIGVLGWNNAPVPFLTLFIWYCGIGCLGVLGLSGMTKKYYRQALAFLVTLCTVIVIPLVYTILTATSLGYILQGRYIYPIAIGLIILAATLANHVTISKLRVTRVLVALTAIGNIFAFVWILRRYMVGLSTLNLFGQLSNKWSPPIPCLLLVVFYITVNLLTISLMYRIANTISLRKANN